MWSLRRALGSICLLGVVTTAAALAAETSSRVERLAILDRSIELHGGDAFLHSEVAFTIRSRSGAFRVVARRDGGLFDYQVTREGGDGVAVYRHRNDQGGGDTVERWQDGDSIELDETARQRVRDFVSQRVYFAALPFRFNDPSTYKQDLGTEVWHGRSLRKVKLTFEPGTSSSADSEFLLWFDPETARLEQFAYSFRGGLRFRPLVNYRRIGGILFFDQENYALDGRGQTVDVLSPGFVKESMTLLSVVRLEDIEVRPLR